MNLNEKTKASLGFVFLVGAYIVSLENRVQANTLRVGDLAEAKKLIVKIDRRLARIEGALGIKIPKQEKENDSE